MNAPCVDLAQYLAALGGIGAIGASSGWAISQGREPAEPDNTITIYDTGGTDPFVDAEMYEPTVQVRVRANSYVAAYAKIQEVAQALIVPTARDINDAHYVGIWQVGGVVSLGNDANNRTRLVVNFKMKRHPLEVAP